LGGGGRAEAGAAEHAGQGVGVQGTAHDVAAGGFCAGGAGALDVGDDFVKGALLELGLVAGVDAGDAGFRGQGSHADLQKKKPAGVSGGLGLRGSWWVRERVRVSVLAEGAAAGLAGMGVEHGVVDALADLGADLATDAAAEQAAQDGTGQAAEDGACWAGNDAGSRTGTCALQDTGYAAGSACDGADGSASLAADVAQVGVGGAAGGASGQR